DLVNCSGKLFKGMWFGAFGKEPPPDEREDLVWSHLNSAFAEPITPTDATADYAPTQVLAEVFKQAGFHGIMYGSSVGPGTNVALFDLRSANVVYRKVFRATKLQYEFDTDFLRRRKRK